MVVLNTGAFALWW